MLSVPCTQYKREGKGKNERLKRLVEERTEIECGEMKIGEEKESRGLWFRMLCF